MYQIAYFNDQESALAWRKDNGGWIFASDNGDFVHFPYTFTPSRIFLHPATRGQSGTLL